ncbi:MAG: capsule assembly Wzi family protein [Candidatus Eisenbacteria bacterium]
MHPAPKRLLSLCAVALLIGLLGGGRPARASTLPYIPLDHWSTPLITEAIGRGLLTGVSLSDLPYQRAAVARTLKRARAAADSTQRNWTPFEAWLLERIEVEVSAGEPAPTPAFSRVASDWLLGYGIETRAEALTGEDQRRFGDADAKGILLPYIGFQSGRGLAAGIRFRMDTDGAQVSDFNGRPWRHGWTGDTKNAYALLQLGKAEVLFGRDDLRWGPSEYSSLLLSSNAPNFDQVGMRVFVGPVTFESIFTNLDDMTLENPFPQAPGDTLATGTVVKRHLSAHRLQWQVSPSVAFGVAEAVVYGGKDRGLEPEYVIPISIYYAGQWNSDRNDNALLSFTTHLRLKQDVELYGELLVDDFQFEHKTKGDEEPFEGGFLIGQRLYNPLGLDGSSLRVEFAKVEPFTYNQSMPWNRYLYKDQPIGFSLGPDAQAMDIEFRRWISEQLTWTFLFRREERGATRVTDPWPVSGSGPDSLNGFPSFDHVPTGVVERRSRYATDFWLHPRAGLDLHLGGGYVRVENIENAKGVNRNEWFVGAALRLNWSRWFSPSENRQAMHR